jgi:SPP1 family predicted phage head-tail adaptor
MLGGINIGKLDLLLTFEESTSTRNSMDEAVQTWTTYKTMYGARKFNNSPDSIESKQQVGTNDVEFTVRYDSGLTSNMRFKQGSETTYFYVRSVEGWQREGYSIVRAERRDNE